MSVSPSTWTHHDFNDNDPALLCKTKIKGPTSIRKVHYWSVERVSLWLKKHCATYYRLYGKLFREHEISGRVLIQLTDYKLLLMGITDNTHREDIMLQILKLKLQIDKCDLKDLDKANAFIDEDL